MTEEPRPPDVVAGRREESQLVAEIYEKVRRYIQLFDPTRVPFSLPPEVPVSLGRTPPIIAAELEVKAQRYADDMLQQLDAFNAEHPLPEGEDAQTAPDRERLRMQFKQFFYHHMAAQHGVVPG